VAQLFSLGHLAHNIKIMKALFALVGLATSFFLSGCAHDQAEATTKPASQPPATPAATFKVNSTGTAPITYQWYFNTNNIQSQTIQPATNK
jgi:uncharacterized lipoprotein YbaY